MQFIGRDEFQCVDVGVNIKYNLMAKVPGFMGPGGVVGCMDLLAGWWVIFPVFSL
jgi:hypothetical protein